MQLKREHELTLKGGQGPVHYIEGERVDGEKIGKQLGIKQGVAKQNGFINAH